MGDFRRDGGKRFGGNRGGGGFGRRSRNGSGDRDRGPVSMHKAICDQCKKECEVPFRPTGDKPVYCNDCFSGRKEGGDSRGGRFGRENFDDRKPQSQTRTDFGSESVRNNDELKKQLESLNTKMERLIKAVESMAYAKPIIPDEKVKDTPKTKKVAKKVSKK